MKKFSLLLTFIFFIHLTHSQTSTSISFKRNNGFILNKGQFQKNRDWQPNQPILYTYDANPFYIFFGKTGITYRISKPVKKQGKRTMVSELTNIHFVNANPAVEIIPSQPNRAYLSYSYKLPDGSIKSINRIPSYRQITYKNIYRNIDLIYTIHPEKGIEYSFIIHQGGNPNDIKLQYSGKHTHLDNEFINISLNRKNQLIITSSLGEITEHKPETFYKQSGKKIASEFIWDAQKQTLGFSLDTYDTSEEIIIDPWVVATTYSNSSAPWEVETDGNNNIYVTGGESPMILQKYNVNGNLQWTYNTPWDTANYWLGTLATDNAGNSYITAGTSAEIHKIDNNGNVRWINSLSNSTDEYWAISFNCDQSKFFIGGTSGNYTPNTLDYYATIFEGDTSNGSISNILQLTHTDVSVLGTPPIEIRASALSPTGRIIFLTHDSIFGFNQNITSPNSLVFAVPNAMQYSYRTNTIFPEQQNGSPLKAIAAGTNYFYIHEGDSVSQWDINTGVLIRKVYLPLGSKQFISVGAAGFQINNMGIVVDSCNNVYAGATNNIVKFDENLTLLSQINTNYIVHDLVLQNNTIIAVGAQYNNSVASRIGSIESISIPTCNNINGSCCNTSFYPDTSGIFCETDTSVIQFTASVPGGVWSISPATQAFDSINATLDLGAAQNAAYLITYTLACGSSSYPITKGLDTSVTFSNNTLTANQNNVSYQWLDCNNNMQPITSATGQSFTVTSSGSYAVALNYNNGCQDTSMCHTIIITGIRPNHQVNNIVIYPNPVNAQLTISNLLSNNSYQISIYDILGKQISYYEVKNSGNYQINVKDLTAGIYFIEILENHQTNSKKIVKLIKH